MRPQFQKSRPAAIYSIAQLNPDRFIELIPTFLDGQYLPPWDCRYAVMLALEAISDQLERAQLDEILIPLVDDDDCFVKAKLATMQLV